MEGKGYPGQIPFAPENRSTLSLRLHSASLSD